MPLGVLLMVLGLAGSATACFQNEAFGGTQAQGGPTGQTDTQLTQGPDDAGPNMLLATLSGLCLAAGVVFMGVGVGHWKRPIPSDVRPANPWSDQPGEHGDPPKGLV
ncbi:MAG: hypothetical protein AB7N29_04365 [Vicinamibacterales bacterium]